jgi:hypothetical protein
VVIHEDQPVEKIGMVERGPIGIHQPSVIITTNHEGKYRRDIGKIG